jgi:hypothetical protein
VRERVLAPGQVEFRAKKGYEMVVRLLSSPSPMVKELACYALGGACSGQRRMQQAAAKAKGTFTLQSACHRALNGV